MTKAHLLKLEKKAIKLAIQLNTITNIIYEEDDFLGEKTTEIVMDILDGKVG